MNITFAPELIEVSEDVWTTSDGRFVLVLAEPEPDTFVYILSEGNWSREFVAFNSAREYVKRAG